MARPPENRGSLSLSEVALGHDAALTLSDYGHIVDELQGQPQVSAENAIRAARAKAPQVPRKASG